MPRSKIASDLEELRRSFEPDGSWPGVRPDPTNPNTHPDEQLEEIAQSLQEFGFDQPIVVDKKGMIAKGEGRFLAATRKLKWIDGPVVMVDDDEIGRIRRNLADNATQRLSVMDNTRLSKLFAVVNKDEHGGHVPGFTPETVSAFLQSLEKEEEGTGKVEEPDWENDPVDEEADQYEELSEQYREKWKTEVGQVWQLGEHRLVIGDSTDPEVLKEATGGETPALVVTDPPYGVKYDWKWRLPYRPQVNFHTTGEVTNDDRVDWSPVFKLLDAPVLYVWHASWHSIDVGQSLRDIGYEVAYQIIWVKSHHALGRGDYHWQHEPCWYMVKKGHKHNWQGRRDQYTTWEAKPITSGRNTGEEAWGHSTQKPFVCMARPVQNNSAEGELVCDPFSGTGTTLIACERLKRRCAAVEISPAYAASILERWSRETEQTPELVGTMAS